MAKGGLRKLILGLIVLGLAARGPAGARAPRELKIGFSPSESISDIKRHAAPVVRALARQLDMEVVPFIATDYTGLIEAMRAGKLDVAFLGPQAYILANKEAGARVLLKVKRNRSDHYYAAIITRTDSGIRNLKDLQDHTFAYTDAVSTTGYVYPRLMLSQAGVANPDRFFRSVIFGGGHEQVVLAVLNKKVDAGAVYSNDLQGK
ncbi:MAG: phosphate/phosphite/phosphonate ABC transporter substrate-binding protein, partial [Nevskia sp.]|nr:phosphate/phosphite/phosphonate ABC transporter substrate-binding protein [Nevskia sp.]